MIDKLMMACLGAMIGGFFATTIALLLLSAILWQHVLDVGEAHSWWLTSLGMLIGGFVGWRSALEDEK